ncbi:piggyBac transposable element-derived protein 4 [Trichonephila clavipes]|uniref:PiggyBac transposable element-derived protein 4 n=1 Tax=Trichonephila clavipes TaxID=2585209 RepID=A0A8X6R804_TRICX|nr:piggyBac transposable element-derived protein 4 [Trichonephila clavipes]
MKLTEKLISENHRDEFSATSGKPSISPSPLRLTSMHFSDVIPASEKKKSNPTRQCSRDCAPVIEIPEISHALRAIDFWEFHPEVLLFTRNIFDILFHPQWNCIVSPCP